jgi:hypothetical protein
MARTKKEKPEIKVGSFVKDAPVVQMVWKTKREAVDLGYIDPDFSERGLYVPVRVTRVARVTPGGVVSIIDNTNFWRVDSGSGEKAENIGYSPNKKHGSSSNIIRVIEPARISVFEDEISRWNKLEHEHSIKVTNERNEKTRVEYYTTINAYDAAVEAGMLDDQHVIMNSKMIGAVVRVLAFPSAVFLVTTKYSTIEYYDTSEVTVGKASITGHVNQDSNYINTCNLDIQVDRFQWRAWQEAGIADKVEIEKYLLGKVYLQILERIHSNQ